MKQDSSTLRLIYPQWQGGGTISDFVPELSAEDAYKGYYLGAKLLDFLAPKTSLDTVEVPISLDIKDRVEENGIIAYQTLLKQSREAMDLLKLKNPNRIVTLGGECSVSVVPFTYLLNKYQKDVAVVWIDAHPDLNLPYEGHRGFHAMALAACLGLGDKQILDIFPSKIQPSKAIIIGLRSWEFEGGTPQRQKEWGVKHLSPEQVANNSSLLLEWLKATGASKVLIHFDMDVIDPKEMIAAVGTDPDGMKIDEVVRLINDINESYDIVGLTVAEPMPRVAIKIQNMMSKLPLLGK